MCFFRVFGWRVPAGGQNNSTTVWPSGSNKRSNDAAAVSPGHTRRERTGFHRLDFAGRFWSGVSTFDWDRLSALFNIVIEPVFFKSVCRQERHQTLSCGWDERSGNLFQALENICLVNGNRLASNSGDESCAIVTFREHCGRLQLIPMMPHYGFRFRF
jgi:hypothetical protein